MKGPHHILYHNTRFSRNEVKGLNNNYRCVGLSSYCLVVCFDKDFNLWHTRGLGIQTNVQQGLYPLIFIKCVDSNNTGGPKLKWSWVDKNVCWCGLNKITRKMSLVWYDQGNCTSNESWLRLGFVNNNNNNIIILGRRDC